MEKLTDRTSQVIENMKREGRMVVLSAEDSSSIDHALAKEIFKIKQDFEQKERNSRAFVAKVELGYYSY